MTDILGGPPAPSKGSDAPLATRDSNTSNASSSSQGGRSNEASNKPNHGRDLSSSSITSDTVASPASGSSNEGLRRTNKTKSSNKSSMVLVTIDGEQINAVDVSGMTSGAALRERMLFRAHIANSEMSSCTIHWGPLGEMDEIGDALSNEELMNMCRNPAALPRLHAFVVKLNASIEADVTPASSTSAPGIAPALNRSPQLSDQLVSNIMLSDQVDETSEDEQPLVSSRRGSRNRSSQARSSDPAPLNGRVRSDSDPYGADRRQGIGRSSVDWPGFAPSERRGSYERPRLPPDERDLRRMDWERQHSQQARPNTANGLMSVPPPMAQPGRGVPMYGNQPPVMSPQAQRYPVNHLPSPPTSHQQRMPSSGSSGPRIAPPQNIAYPLNTLPPLRGQIAPMPPAQIRPSAHHMAGSQTLGPQPQRPMMPIQSVEDIRGQYRTVPHPSRHPQIDVNVHAELSRQARAPQDLRGPRPDASRYSSSNDAMLYSDARHTIGPRSMTPTPRSAPIPATPHFPGPGPAQSYMRQTSGPMTHMVSATEPRKAPIPSPPPSTMSHSVWSQGTIAPSHGRAPPSAGRSQPASATMPSSSTPLLGPGSSRPPPELLAGQYMAPRITPPSARSPTGSAPLFDARQKLPLQPGEVLQDALAGETLHKRQQQQTLPRLETNRAPSPSKLSLSAHSEPITSDFARYSPAADGPASARSSRRPSANELDLEAPPAARSPAAGHTPTSSSSSSTSDRPSRSSLPDALIPGRIPNRSKVEETSSPRRSEDESSVHTFSSSGRPSSRSSQTSVESPIVPPPPACPAAPSAPELWEDDVDGPEDSATWVSPEQRGHRKTVSTSSTEGGSTVRQRDWLHLDVGSGQGSLGISEDSTLTAARPSATLPNPMPSEDAFADDFDDDIEASTWAGPRKRSTGETEEGSKTVRPALKLQMPGQPQRQPTNAKSGPLRSVSKQNSSATPISGSTTGASEGLSRANARKAVSHRGQSSSPVQRKPTMRGDVRPSAEQVYDNLDVFFPNHDLDKPILVDVASSTADSPSSPSGRTGAPPAATGTTQQITREMKVMRHKSIRVVAKDRAKQMERSKEIEKAAHDKQHTSKGPSALSVGIAGAKALLLRRRSTKMWGRKTEEVTPSEESGSREISVAPVSDTTGEESFKWVKGDLIGKGSYGRVFLAFNVTNGDMLAVKQVELPKTANDREDDRQTGSINALKFEIETLKDLNHPNIVLYLGFEQTPENLSIFLEYVPGGSVGRWVRKFGKFEEAVVKFFTIQILDGLAYLHSNGILHRDLKADNVLVDNEGSIRISDFGISKKSANVYEANEFMSMQGSIFWMAPEVVHNAKKGYSAKVDIWSLGCVVLEMFAGRRPWDTEMAIAAMFKIGAERLAPPVPDDVKLSPEAEAFLSRCFIVDATQRPTAGQLMEAPLMRNARDIDFQTTALGMALSQTAGHSSSTLTQQT